jgi:hypothetical protein
VILILSFLVITPFSYWTWNEATSDDLTFGAKFGLGPRIAVLLPHFPLIVFMTWTWQRVAKPEQPQKTQSNQEPQLVELQFPVLKEKMAFEETIGRRLQGGDG